MKGEFHMELLRKEGSRRVQATLTEEGYPNKVVELSDNAHTAQAAADSLGCDVAQIAKSIVFRLKESDSPLLVIASGINRVNEKKVAAALNQRVGKADADFVREKTGFVIGDVSPIGHVQPIQTILDEDLFQYKTLWATAGHPKTVFELTATQLVEMTGGQVMSIT